jgi:hypothetical protein
MKTLQRDEAISRITESRIDTILTDPFYITSLLEEGHKGFNFYSNDELIQEYNYEFDEQINIKN